MQKTIINLKTGISKKVDVTDKEILELEVIKHEFLETQNAERETAKKKLSGRNKLLALGLTEAEVTALIG